MSSYHWWARGTKSSGRPFPPEVGELRVDSKRFVRHDGSTFGWRGATWFLGHARHLRGENVRPHLDRFVSLGVNVVRVFGRVPWGGEWEFYRDPRDDLSVRVFFALCADYGMRCQYVPLTYDDWSNKQERRLQTAYDIAASFPLVTVQDANEPHVNHIDVPYALRGVNKRGVLSCSGEYYVVSESGETGDGVLPAPPFKSFPLTLDYGDLHTERNDRYARNGKEPREFTDYTRKPWIDGEPWGFGEHAVAGGGARTTDLPAAVGHHAIAHLMCPGSCLHTQAGLEGRAPMPDTDPVQSQMCETIAAIWRFIPEHAYTGEYSRPHLGNFPLAWSADDSDSATGHAYASRIGDVFYACVPLPRPDQFNSNGELVRPGWTAEGVDGWRVVDALAGWPNVVRLER